jgi:hypothetical protein
MSHPAEDPLRRRAEFDHRRRLDREIGSIIGRGAYPQALANLLPPPDLIWRSLKDQIKDTEKIESMRSGEADRLPLAD